MLLSIHSIFCHQNLSKIKSLILCFSKSQFPILISEFLAASATQIKTMLILLNSLHDRLNASSSDIPTSIGVIDASILNPKRLSSLGMSPLMNLVFRIKTQTQLLSLRMIFFKMTWMSHLFSRASSHHLCL